MSFSSLRPSDIATDTVQNGRSSVESISNERTLAWPSIRSAFLPSNSYRKKKHFENYEINRGISVLHVIVRTMYKANTYIFLSEAIMMVLCLSTFYMLQSLQASLDIEKEGFSSLSFEKADFKLSRRRPRLSHKDHVIAQMCDE